MSTPQEICDMVVQAVKQITGESSNSVKLKQPHEYSGERDVRIIDNWCSAIETHKDFYGWGDDKAFIFASTLMAGRAAEWLRVYKEYHPNDAPKTWTALKAELLQNFRPARSVDDARDALDSLVQTGSMQEYCDNFMDIIMLIPGMTQEEQCHQFRKGIQDMELQAQLRDYQPAQRKIQTYFTHALNYAATRPHLGSSGTSSFPFGGNRGMVVTRGAQQQGYSYGTGGGGGTQGGVEPMDLDAMTGRGNSSTVVCYFCNKPGHVKRHCRERIEAIRKLDNTHRYNNGGSGSPKGKKKQFYKKPRRQLNAMDNSNDSPPPTAHDDNDDNKLNTTCEHYVKGSSLSHKKTKCQLVTAKMVEPLSARLDSDVPHLDQLNSATSSSSCDLPLYGGFAYSHGGDRHVPVKVLVDSGASECYIKPSIAQQLEGIWSKVDREVETAGGTVHKITDKLDYVLNLQGYKVPVSSFVYDSKFDIILGRSWLKQHKPQFNWDNDTLTFYDTTVENMVAKYLITPKQVDRLLKHKEAEVYLLHVCEDHNKEVQITMSMDTEWKKQLSQEYPGVFQSKLSGVPSTQEVEHVIDTGDAAPINKPAYKMSPLELDELKRQLKELLAAGMIRPSTSPWGSPVLFVKKKDGSMRMCIDYRALNKVTVRNTFPLPRIDECLDRLKGASYFSCLDLKSGYHQIRIKDTDIPKTAINTRYGKFEWSVLGMGLCNSPPTFQAWMNKLLGYECIDKFALCYLDDVCIFSPTLDSHKKHIKIVLDKFKEAGLIVNIDKCRFAQQKLVFLGFEICQHGIQPSAQKVKAVQEWPTPSNVQEVRQFMGLAQHYRRFIKAFAHIAAPLTNLTQGSGPKKRAIEWTDACESSFQQLKQLLISAPVLMVPDMSKPFRIETDSSDFGVGGVLLQPGDGDSKQWHPVAFESKKLSLAEQKLPAQERELIGIVHALRTWRCYIDGCPGGYVVCCDHNPLTYFRTQQKPTPRLVRWIADLEMFAPKIIYKPGKENVVADALSRIGDASQPAKESLEPLYLYASWSQLPKELQSDWPLLYAAGTDDKVKSKELKAMLKREKPNFTIKNGRLFRIVKHKEADKPALEVPFVPFSQRADLVSKYHESFGHASVRNLMHLMGKRYWWPRMKTDITE
ncbi:uncharacterized protein ATC70_012342 [Mucor velutinosus]|uniref:Reverse transcriptase n=1 Tax=Mucor velutinosus TaxID=708070 RepID=A0AAN7HR42_9FUNG|nr:hypothetical protein ATC70_012342 [Mucor velutinosus]